MYGSRVATQTLSQLMDVSRMWLGVDKAARIVRMPALDEDLVLRALKEGASVTCGAWTFKATPPRRIPAPANESAWAPGIVAVSTHGFASGLRIDAQSVRLLCEHIQAIEQRRTARLNEEQIAEQDAQRELEVD